MWSVAVTSTLTVDLPAGKRDGKLTILGHYLNGDRRTRVTIDGRDLGWLALDQPLALALGPGTAGKVTITLRHAPPPVWNVREPRLNAFVLQRIEIR